RPGRAHRGARAEARRILFRLSARSCRPRACRSMERLRRLVAAKPGHGRDRHQPGATRLAIQRPQKQGLSKTSSSLSWRNIMGKLRSGIFLAPFHPVDEDPTLAIRRDIELIEWLDKIGFEEAWIGEHHSAGYEIIASPELFIAAAAERTHRIKL